MNESWVVFLQIMKVVPATVLMALLILAASLVLGLFLALAVLYKVPVLLPLSRLYISFIRGTPLLVQLFVWYYTLPEWLYGLLSALHIQWDKNNLSPAVIIIISFSFYYATYQQETVRAAFSSVDHSQKELADSLGYPFWQTIIRVIIPQALLYSLPNIFNTFLSIMKALSLGFTIAVVDIFAQAKLIASLNGNYLLTFALAALVYWIVCLAFSRLLSILEKRLAFR